MDAQEVYQYVRRRILEIRKRRKLTAKAVAEQAGICQSSYSCIETGAYQPTVVNLYRIARALRVDMAELLPPVWEVLAEAPNVTGVREMARLNAFRLREICVLSDATGVGVVFRKGARAEVLSWINLGEHAPRRLLPAIVQGEMPEDWLVLREKEGAAAMYLCLYEAQLEDYLEKLARKYVRLWLLTMIHTARGVPFAAGTFLG